MEYLQEGFFFKGELSGLGREVYSSDQYSYKVGYWMNNDLHGKAIIYQNNKAVQQGQFQRGNLILEKKIVDFMNHLDFE